jgi:16S rRNA (adenine1518-N6/adenine1519-N6)-dimethyltransferase
MAIAKKRFGQNFLVDRRKADGLVDALEITPSDTILEVGPGTGMLTERILSHGANLVSVELDRELIGPLRERIGESPRFCLVESDIIRIDPRILMPDGFKLIGNLPYNISGAMVEWLIEYSKLVKLAVITVQKEVAARLRAGPGTRDYGSLTVMVQAFFDVRRLFDIPPGCFSPKPRVYSTALSLRPNKKIDNDIDYPHFRDFLRAGFAQKRKTLANSLSASLRVAGKEMMSRKQVEDILACLGHRPDIRAEQMTLKDLRNLFKMVMQSK